MSTKAARYTDEFKKQVVSKAISEDHTITEVAKDYGVSDQTLRNWIRASQNNKQPDKVRVAKLEEELRKYKRRVADLEDTNEILKKAAAIFAIPNRK